MFSHTIRPTAFVAAALTSTMLMGAGAAFADEAHRVRGTIDKLDGSTLTVITREGPTETITLNDGYKVNTIQKAELSDIEKGDYVGIASLPMENGADGALEVLIFPAGMEGTGEGSYPWDLQPESTMTNATVADKVQAVEGSKVSLTYNDGKTKDITIPADAPIVTFVPGTVADLTEGAPVFVPAMADPAGMITTGTVVVGADGVAPPM